MEEIWKFERSDERVDTTDREQRRNDTNEEIQNYDRHGGHLKRGSEIEHLKVVQ